MPSLSYFSSTCPARFSYSPALLSHTPHCHARFRLSSRVVVLVVAQRSSAFHASQASLPLSFFARSAPQPRFPVTSLCLFHRFLRTVRCTRCAVGTPGTVDGVAPEPSQDDTQIGRWDVPARATIVHKKLSGLILGISASDAANFTPPYCKVIRVRLGEAREKRRGDRVPRCTHCSWYLM